jgi:ABC-type branched-subunit amino acid transport system substrate-binding protein
VPERSGKGKEICLSLLLLVLITMWIGAPITYVLLKWKQGPLLALVEGILAFGGLNLLDPLILKLEKNTLWVRASYSKLEAWFSRRRLPTASHTLKTLTTKRLWRLISLGGLISLLLLTLVDPSLPQAIHTIVASLLPQPCRDGICVFSENEQKIGISMGQDHFWTQKTDPVDAEQLIYSENHTVLANTGGYQYYEMVVVTTLSEGADARHTEAGHDDLRGILLLQQLVNDYPDSCLQGPHGCRKLVVLIANAGDTMEYATTIAQQIFQVALANPATFIGVTGWPLSTRPSIEGLRILTNAAIPVISSTASSDALSALSPYFFRVIPPDSEQGPIGAHYAEQIYPTRRVAIVFADQMNPYSLTLASAFMEEFTRQEGNQVLLETYDSRMKAAGRLAMIGSDIQDAFFYHRDVLDNPRNGCIYFAGYSEDFSRLLNILRTNYPEYSQMPTLSGDSVYDKNDFKANVGGTVYTNIVFTAFAHPDEWSGQKKPQEVSAFFANYQKVYASASQRADRPDAGTILSYDAATILFHAALTTNILTRQNIQKALAGINQCHPFQGISGAIAFAPDGNPIQKVLLILTVDANGQVTFSPQSIQQGHVLASPPQRCTKTLQG